MPMLKVRINELPPKRPAVSTFRTANSHLLAASANSLSTTLLYYFGNMRPELVSDPIRQ